VHFLLDTGSRRTVINTCLGTENCPTNYFDAPDDISCSSTNQTVNYVGAKKEPGPICKAQFSISGLEI
jgi:hypothetical protein